MIHVCFGLHDAAGNYSKFTGTAICSIFENTASNVTVHILHDNTLTQDNREKFIYLAGQYNQHVNFHNVEKICADKINEIIKMAPFVKTAWFSVGSLYRLLMAQIISADIGKIIYLDSDIIVNLDINELWKIDLDDKALAVIPESFNKVDVTKRFVLCQSGTVKAEDYFNSGVMVMNLNVLRGEEELIMRGIKFIAEHQKRSYFDQDIFNYCFSARTVKLPTKFNRFLEYVTKSEGVGQKIYHYAGGRIYLEMNNPFSRLWMNYFMKTPFFDEQTIGRLYSGFRQMHVGLKNSMIQISAMLSGKTRAFFITPNNRDAFKKIFSIRDDEEIILAENNASLKKLLDAMKNSRGKKVFFILLPNFPFNVLTQVGFVAGRDFVNGSDFLSEAHGVPLNSYPLLKAM